MERVAGDIALKISYDILRKGGTITSSELHTLNQFVPIRKLRQIFTSVVVKDAGRAKEVVDLCLSRIEASNVDSGMPIIITCLQAAEMLSDADYSYICTKANETLQMKTIKPAANSFYKRLGYVDNYWKEDNLRYTKYGLPQEFDTYLDELRKVGEGNTNLRNTVLDALEALANMPWPKQISDTVRRVSADISNEIKGPTRQVII